MLHLAWLKSLEKSFCIYWIEESYYKMLSLPLPRTESDRTQCCPNNALSSVLCWQIDKVSSVVVAAKNVRQRFLHPLGHVEVVDEVLAGLAGLVNDQVVVVVEVVLSSVSGHQVLQRLVGVWLVGEVTLIFCLISFIKKTGEIADSRRARGHGLAQRVGLQVAAGAG